MLLFYYKGLVNYYGPDCHLLFVVFLLIVGFAVAAAGVIGCPVVTLPVAYVAPTFQNMVSSDGASTTFKCWNVQVWLLPGSLSILIFYKEEKKITVLKKAVQTILISRILNCR